jgi:large subunit ribosomal protein L21
MNQYAVISVGGKQYRVREGQRLLVDRLAVDEGKTFHPDLLMLGGDDEPKLGDGLEGQQVTAKVAGHVLGDKVVVGKHKKRTGYRRRNGFRARLTQIEIQSIGKKATRSATAKKTTRASRSAGTRSTTRKPAAKKSEEKA